jgi:hypothetical protein
MNRRLVIAALGLGACGQLPQPFKGGPKVTSDLAVLDVPSAVGIAVVPIRGAPDPFNAQLAKAVAVELERREIPAESVIENRGLGFSLSGEVLSATEANGQAALQGRWSLRSKRGSDAGSYTQRFTIRALEWREGSIEGAGRMGRDAADVVVAMIEGTDSLTTGPTVLDQPARAKPVAPSYATFTVRPVEGAPGDGRDSLQAALAQALVAKGVRRNDVAPDVVLMTRVDVSPSAAGQDFIEIVCRAITQDGRDIGEAKLTNIIPRDALVGRWGPTATTIANAALPDILELLSIAPRL